MHRLISGSGSVGRRFEGTVVIDSSPVDYGLKLLANFDGRFSGDFGGSGYQVVGGVGKVTGFIADRFCFGLHFFLIF